MAMTHPVADEEQEIDMALRAAAYGRWVELREQRKPGDAERHDWIRASLMGEELSPEQFAAVASKMLRWAKIPSGLLQSVAVFPTNKSLESVRLADDLALVLGAAGAGWSVNRSPVTYGMDFAVSGVAILTSTDARGIEVATDLAKTLEENGIVTAVIPNKRPATEVVEGTAAAAGAEQHNSAISVFVGEKPL
jgi:hypothetical protein